MGAGVSGIQELGSEHSESLLKSIQSKMCLPSGSRNQNISFVLFPDWNLIFQKIQTFADSRIRGASRNLKAFSGDLESDNFTQF